MSKPDDAPPMRMLPHGSTRIHLAGPEAGPRVLLVHGMTYPLEVWEPLATDLSTAGYRVARYDLYGRGEADWDGVALSPAALADQAYAVLDLLGRGRGRLRGSAARLRSGGHARGVEGATPKKVPKSVFVRFPRGLGRPNRRART